MPFIETAVAAFVVAYLLLIHSQLSKLRVEVTKLRLVVDPDPAVRERLAKKLEVGMLG